MERTVTPAPVATRPPSDDYAQLKRIVAARGLLERRPRRHIVPMLGMLALLAIVCGGLLIARGSWWSLVWTVPAAVLFGQLGFSAHDAAHNQVLTTSRKNYALSVVLFNLFLVGSRGWWADKHNLHHAQPNRLGTDPDIEGGPIAVSAEQATDARGLTRLVMLRQSSVIWPLLSLGVLQIHVYSAGFLMRGRRRGAVVEPVLFVVHYLVYLGALILLLGVGGGLVFALVHQLLLGLYLGGAFLPNHIGMAMLQPEDDVDFLHRQVLTARNIRSSRVANYAFGGLNCQIEHHLFPAMPRFSLRASAPIVRAFCAERGIDYRETGVVEAYAQVYRRLRSVARGMGRLPAGVPPLPDIRLRKGATLYTPAWRPPPAPSTSLPGTGRRPSITRGDEAGHQGDATQPCASLPRLISPPG